MLSFSPHLQTSQYQPPCWDGVEAAVTTCVFPSLEVRSTFFSRVLRTDVVVIVPGRDWGRDGGGRSCGGNLILMPDNFLFSRDTAVQFSYRYSLWHHLACFLSPYASTKHHYVRLPDRQTALAWRYITVNILL